MADNVNLPVAGTGTIGPVPCATDDVGGVHYQRVKLDVGADGATSPVAAGNPLPITGTVALDSASLTALETITVAQVTAALPAGTNNIGDVDVLSLPALPAGNNNIGDVDVASLPALPAGTNNIGDVDVLTLPPLPAGANNIGDVDVLSLPALPAGNNNIGDVDVASMPTGANAAQVQGTAAHGAASAQNPVQIGGRASAAAPADVSADDDVARVWITRKGAVNAQLRDGSGDSVMDDANDAVRVNVVAGAGGGTALQDNATFTPGTTSFTPIGGEVDDTGTTTTAEGQAGAARMTSQRAIFVSVRDASGAAVVFDEAVAADHDGFTSGSTRAGVIGATSTSGAPPALIADDLLGVLAMTRRRALLTSLRVAGSGQDVAADHDAVAPTGTVAVGLTARDTDGSAVASGDATRALATLVGKQVTLPYALPGETWDYAPPTGGLVTTSDVEAKAAVADERHYITDIEIQNTHQSISTEIVIKSGSTVKRRFWAQAGAGGCVVPLPKPIRCGVNEAVNIAEVTATPASAPYGGVLVNLGGYTAAE